jgi:hypothetical protein
MYYRRITTYKGYQLSANFSSKNPYYQQSWWSQSTDPDSIREAVPGTNSDTKQEDAIKLFRAFVNKMILFPVDKMVDIQI